MNINKAVYLLFSSFKNKSTNLFFEAITFVHVFKYLPKPGFSWGGGNPYNPNGQQIYIECSIFESAFLHVV